MLKGKVKPEYGKKKIVIKVSQSQKTGYNKFKTIKTDRRGKYRVTLPRRSGTWYWFVTSRATPATSPRARVEDLGVLITPEPGDPGTRPSGTRRVKVEA